MIEIISKHPIENISIHQFTKFNALFTEINSFLQDELKIKETLENWTQTNIEEVKNVMLDIHGDYIPKMNFDHLLSLKTQHGKNFLSYFHKNNLDALKQSLEQESWQVSDIPYTYKVYFDLMLEGVSSKRKESFTDKQDIDEEDIFRSSRPDVNDLEIVKKLAIGETNTLRENSTNRELGHYDYENHVNEIVEIKKSELILANRKFKINSSVLVLIRLMCDYYNIAYKFDYLTETAISKLFDLLKFYNSFSRRLISNAEAIMFGKVKKITAKILGLSIVSLDLIQTILGFLDKTVQRTIPLLNEDFRTKEVSTVKSEMDSHISEIKAKICLILKTKLTEQCNELKYLNWGTSEGKINIPTKSSASILHNIRQMYKNIEDVLFKEQLVDLFITIFKDLKENFIPVFEHVEIENKLAAKRIKEELEYFKDDLHHIPIFQAEELNFKEFEEKIANVIENKCNGFLTIEKNGEEAAEL